MYYCCGITDMGFVSHNEDALLIGGSVLCAGRIEQNINAPFIAAVSDGVSSERSGEVASKMCLEMIRDIHYNSRTRLDSRLMDIHTALADYSRNDPDVHNMQSTLCGIAVDENDEILSFNVGDSRLYRFRSGRISQLSRDQSLVQLLYEEGSITLEERRTHVHRNIIFPAFGNTNTKPKVDIMNIDGGMQYGDLLLLCTDGLSDYVSPIDMEEILEQPKPLPERLDMLVQRAKDKQTKDNITAIAMVKY